MQKGSGEMRQGMLLAGWWSRVVELKSGWPSAMRLRARQASTGSTGDGLRAQFPTMVIGAS
ncbi:hypothetical protein D3C87_1717680 [compost metagenome]